MASRRAPISPLYQYDAAPVFTQPEFSLRNLDEEWDSADRYEFEILYHAQRDIQVETVAGIYLYYEEKEWSEAGARGVSSCAGTGTIRAPKATGS